MIAWNLSHVLAVLPFDATSHLRDGVGSGQLSLVLDLSHYSDCTGRGSRADERHCAGDRSLPAIGNCGEWPITGTTWTRRRREPSLYGQQPFGQFTGGIGSGGWTEMTRHRKRFGRHWVWSAGAICGLALAEAAWPGVGWATDPVSPRDGLETAGVRASAADAEMEASFQTLGVNTMKTGSSTTVARKQALHDLPLERLSNEARGKAESLLKNIGMFRRLPSLSFEVDPDVYGYFVRNPDVAVATWRAMDISKFNLQEVGPNRYHADAGDGSIGEVELFYHTPEDTLIHCDGAFKSPLLPKPIVARSLMRLQTTFAKEPDGRVIGTHSGDVFVEFPSQAIETVAKAISPVSHTIADRNFKQMTLFAHLMSQAMAKHPGWIEVIGNKLDGVDAKRKQEFMEVSARSHAIARKRLNTSVKPVSLFTPDELLAPLRQSGVPNNSFSFDTFQFSQSGRLGAETLTGTASLRE